MVAGDAVGFAGAVGVVNVLGVGVAAAIGIRRAGSAVMLAAWKKHCSMHDAQR